MAYHYGGHACWFTSIFAGLVSNATMRQTFAAAVLLTAVMTAQEPARPATFDAASIKPHTSDDRGLRVEARPGRFIANNAAVIHVMEYAFGLRADQVLGGDEWVRTDRFDIEAVTPPDTPPEDVPRLVRQLLRDRFQLVVTNEVREQPVYVLQNARTDGRLGSALVPNEMDCGPVLAARRAGPPARPTSFGERPVCTSFQFTMFQEGKGVVITIKGGAAPLSELTERLAGLLRRSIVDRTGLAGRFDFDLQFVPDPPAGGTAPATANELGVSLFTAVQEQLGLRLQPDRGQVPVLIVERVARPSEN
jgi:uncharacterized protein (TIGR03435 family)